MMMDVVGMRWIREKRKDCKVWNGPAGCSGDRQYDVTNKAGCCDMAIPYRKGRTYSVPFLAFVVAARREQQHFAFLCVVHFATRP
jgi:hypothetical protein